MSKRILVQAGHIAPREPGFEGGTGTVREQEFTYAMRKRLCSLLNADDRFDCIPQPGDLTDVPCDAAIFLHGDGSSNKDARGRSFGFPDHSVNKRLANLLEKHLEAIPGSPPPHSWNYTGGLRFYYGYSRVSTSGPEVLIEHGFMTNPTEQAWLFSHLNEQAQAEYEALCEYFGFAPQGTIVPKRPGWIVEWTDKAGVRHRTRRGRSSGVKRLWLRLWADGLRRKIIVRKDVPIPSS